MGYGVFLMLVFLFVFESIGIPHVSKILAGKDLQYLTPIRLGNCFYFGIGMKLTVYFAHARIDRYAGAR